MNDRQKVEDLRIINKYSKISIADACRKFGINQSNLKKGHVKPDVIHKVRLYIESEFAKLYVRDFNDE